MVLDTHGTILGPGRVSACDFCRRHGSELAFPHRSRQQRICGLHSYVLVAVKLVWKLAARARDSAKIAKALVAHSHDSVFRTATTTNSSRVPSEHIRCKHDEAYEESRGDGKMYAIASQLVSQSSTEA